jgi:hypothetical protein
MREQRSSGPRTRPPRCRPARVPWTSCPSPECSKTSAATPTTASRSSTKPGRRRGGQGARRAQGRDRPGLIGAARASRELRPGRFTWRSAPSAGSLPRTHPAGSSGGTQISQICVPPGMDRSRRLKVQIGGSGRGYLAVGGASQQSRYGLLDGRLFCIFIHRHPWGDCPHLPRTRSSAADTAVTVLICRRPQRWCAAVQRSAACAPC